MEDKEALKHQINVQCKYMDIYVKDCYLKTNAIFSKPANPVCNHISNLTSNSVVATSIIICCIFLASYQLIRVEQLSISSSSYSIYSN